MKFSAKQLALMGVLIAFNVALGGTIHILKLPVFLDAIGTILAVLLLGWFPGIVVGVLSFLVAAAVSNPVYIWFIGTQVWQPRTGKMYTEKAGQWGFSGTHNFEERNYDRATAIAVAKAWIDS